MRLILEISYIMDQSVGVDLEVLVQENEVVIIVVPIEDHFL